METLEQSRNNVVSLLESNKLQERDVEPMATSRKKVWLSLSMTQTVLSELDKVAEKEGRSRSMQARKFIEQMLQVYKAEEAEKARAARAALRGAS